MPGGGDLRFNGPAPAATMTNTTAPSSAVAAVAAVDLADRAVVHLKPKKDRPARRRHPWIFSGAIARVDGTPDSGDVVVVVDSDGEVVGRGAYSPSSQIRVRLWTFDTTAVSEAFFIDALNKAVRLREQLVLTSKDSNSDDVTDGARLVFGEGDGLPGLIVDAYADTIVMQCQSAGAERIKPIVVRFFVERGAARVVERGDADVRQKEGLPSIRGLLAGTPVDGPVVTKEHGMRFFVDVEGGHKTGFYLDQRDSRAVVRGVSRGKRVLNCFCYTGGFSIAALCGGATHVTSVDTSLAALELGERNAVENGFADTQHEWLKGDCFDVLRGLHADNERFDIVILDPPKFAPSAAHLDKAARGYRDLMIRGLRLLTPGGLLFTFSCSGAVERSFFRELAGQAALEVHRPAQVLAELGHSRCHPVALSFPEGEYLKGLMLSVA